MASKGFFQAITNAIEDARLIASRAGRSEIKFSDLKAAIQDWRSPSDAALQRVFENQPKGWRGRAAELDVQTESGSVLPPVEDPLNRLSRAVNPADRREIFSVPA